ncbi:hypothetical protein Mapa_010009 [Marchantia paleacea]|nr:hypothetical protein Mapa_010009 [Marchantia paleacea]
MSMKAGGIRGKKVHPGRSQGLKPEVRESEQAKPDEGAIGREGSEGRRRSEARPGKSRAGQPNLGRDE